MPNLTLNAQRRSNIKGQHVCYDEFPPFRCLIFIIIFFNLIAFPIKLNDILFKYNCLIAL